MPSLNEWKKNSHAQQENLTNSLGQSIWDEFIYSKDKRYLSMKVAVAFFGNNLKDVDDFGMSAENKEFLDEIISKIVTHSYDKEKIRISIIFVYIYRNESSQTIVPLIRVMSKNCKQSVKDVPDNTFIDHAGRVYNNFSAFKNENIWDFCWLCLPKDGYYKAGGEIIYLDQSSQGQVLDVVDKVSTVSNVVTSCTMIAGTVMSFIPLTAPIGIATVAASSIVGAPGAVYGVGRSVCKIVDRYQHEQSISLGDSEARMCWLTTAAALVTVGTISSAKLLTSTARAGGLVSSGTRAVCTGISVTSVTLSGLSIINSAYELSKKEQITTLDIFQMTTSIFFFTHSIVSFKTASAIIKDAQKGKINELKQSVSKEHHNKFDAYLEGTKESSANEFKQTGKGNEMQGQAQFIREMKRIDNMNEFYQHFEMTNDGQFHVNKELTIHPRAFLQLTEVERQNLLTNSQELNNENISLQDFNKRTRPILKKYQIRVDQHREKAQIYLKEKFGVENLSDIKIGAEKLGDAKPHEIDRLENVVKNSFHNGDTEILAVVDKITQKQGTKSVMEYCAAGEYITRKVEKEVAVRMKANPNPERPGGKAKVFYQKQVINEYLNNDNKLTELSNKFTDLSKKCEEYNVGNPKFNNPMAAANHYDKHPYYPKISKSILTPEQYFNIAREMAGGPISDVKWTQDGTSLKCTFYSESRGTMCIRYDNLSNGTSVIATLMELDETTIEETRLYNA